ncbi:MAG: hypothetical protein HYR55_07190 [Acidobacteria bacterium]|nr:hypothetical protein [Acidobacteriota bacterium]MBI3656734.1 hypothetical protein [Acidobacteriota bacterium]
MNFRIVKFSFWLIMMSTAVFCFSRPCVAQDPQPVTVTIETFFAPTPAAPNPIEDGWLREINAINAGSTLRITLYNLTLTTIKDALLAASARGVDVRAIADKFAICNRDGQLNPLAVELSEAQIPIKLYRNSQFPNDIMHNKFFIIDDRILSNGSCNFTAQGTRFNHENMTIIKVVDGEAVFMQEFISQFERMWNDDFPFSGHTFSDWVPLPSDCQGGA